jgi:hypothetical protein
LLEGWREGFGDCGQIGTGVVNAGVHIYPSVIRAIWL